MKNLTLILSIIFLFISCSEKQDASDMILPEGYSSVSGTITDEEGNPIEHLKITLRFDEVKEIVIYTDSDGFYRGMMILDKSYKILTINIEDVDNEENGGQFESLSETIFITEEGPIRIEKNYLLNRATV